jgi:hypothetical protein
LVRQVQEKGFMLPARIILGSQVMEVYTPQDAAAGVRISEWLKDGMSLCEAIEGAEQRLIDCYAYAENKDYHVKGFSETRQLLSDLRVKKLLNFTELGNALDMEPDALDQLLKTCGCEAISLVTPWGAIPCYREEDYLMLRYAKKFILEEGIDTETALQEVIPFYGQELWCDGEYGRDLGRAAVLSQRISF